MTSGAINIPDAATGNGNGLGNGFYISNGDYIDKPSGIGGGQFLGLISMNMTSTNQYKAQIAASYSQSGRMFFRTSGAGKNNEWFEVALLKNGVNTRTFDGDLRINNVSAGVSLVLVNPKATESNHDKWFYFSMGGTNQASYIWVTKATNTGYGINWPQTGGTIALVGTSDERYKKEIKPYDGIDSVNKINEMNLITFIYKDDDKNRVRRGVSAQQLQKIDKQYVKASSEITPEFDEDKNIINSTSKEKLVLDNNVIMMDMLANIKLLNVTVERQKAEIDELKEMLK